VTYITYDTERIIKNNARHNLTKGSKAEVQVEKLTISVDPGLLNRVLEVLNREFKVTTTEDRSIQIVGR
jgi:polyribonucleotide nucleotidyltransferase